ncbi:hypothetical protein [Streptomyces venetus]|uniref:hypothetical protein n=1 Tax=Streptomyces venetus TaxID=1701086 RepID=UPI003C306EA6
MTPTAPGRASPPNAPLVARSSEPGQGEPSGVASASPSGAASRTPSASASPTDGGSTPGTPTASAPTAPTSAPGRSGNKPGRGPGGTKGPK